MVKPIKPEEVDTQQSFPDGVLESFNELIVKNMRNGVSEFLVNDVIEMIASKMRCQRNIVTNNRWTEVESVYREAGWVVTRDNPGWDENYPAKFVFKKRK